MTIICSANAVVRSRWKDALESVPDHTQEIAELAALLRLLTSAKPEIVLLHLSLPQLGGRSGVVALRRDHPNKRFLVFADQPVEAEGLLLLQAGVYGYCNTYMAPGLLARAVEAVQEGEVWVGWNLMQRLIKGLGATVTVECDQAGGVLDKLTEREREIAQHIAGGASNKVIASSLDITERTVKAHLSTIFRKTETRDRLQLALLVANQRATEAVDEEGGQSFQQPIKISR